MPYGHGEVELCTPVRVLGDALEFLAVPSNALTGVVRLWS